MIATHGRSYYVLDNVTPAPGGFGPDGTGGGDAAPHPHSHPDACRAPRITTVDAAVLPEIDYVLGADADSVTMEILAARGGGDPELHRGLRRDGAGTTLHPRGAPPLPLGHCGIPVPGTSRADLLGRHHTGPAGPSRTVPGEADGPRATLTQPFEIVKDPRLTTVTQADFEAQFRLSTEIAARVDDAHRPCCRSGASGSRWTIDLSKSDDRTLAREAGEFRGGDLSGGRGGLPGPDGGRQDPA